MAMKKAAATNGHTNGHVSLGKEEYGAFLAREESYQLLIADHAKTKNLNVDLTMVCDAQVHRMTAFDQKVTHLERLTDLQKMFIDLLRDGTKIGGLDEMSAFWYQWQVHTNKGIDARTLQRDEVTKYEPDLFRSWRNWVHDSGKKDRMFSEAGSRAEREATMPNTAREMQEHVIVRLRQENAKLASRLAQLEAEMEAVKNEKKAQQEKRP